MNDSTLDSLSEILKLFNPFSILMLILGVVVLGLVVKLLRHGGDRLVQRFPSRRLMLLQTTNLLAFLFYTTGFTILVFAVLSPPRELMIAVAGGLAVAVGLAMKDVVTSLVAGIILLFDRPFNVGDRVQFRDHYGEILSIGLRAVRMMTLDDDTVTIPNSVFVTETVGSGNFGDLTMMVVVDVYVAPGADLRKVRELAHEAVVTSRFCFTRKPVVIVMKQVMMSNFLAMQVSIKAYVCDVRYEKAFATDILMRVSEEFQQSGVTWAGGHTEGADIS